VRRGAARFGDLAGGTWQRIVGAGVKLRNSRTDGPNDRRVDFPNAPQYPSVSPSIGAIRPLSQAPGRAARTALDQSSSLALLVSALRWDAFTRFLDDGRLCMSNNAAERELRAVALGRKNWTFAGSDEGGRRAAAIYTLIATAKLNDVDPQAWLADVLARLADHPAKRVHELLPWNWHRQSVAAEAA
jgi:hypothetical protein